ncbi:MAG TPA: AMP-binding protein [Sphingobium sp.]|nr:AMP-binding protein [Sphingobium sp.]
MKIKTDASLNDYHCSSNQERYIRASLSGDNNYFLPLTFIVDGASDLGRFRRAVSNVVNAEPALNVSIHASGGHFICCPAESPVSWGEENKLISRPNLPDKIERFIYSSGGILNGPVCKVHVARLDEAGEPIAITIALHHAVADAVSLGLFCERVSQAYSGVSVPTIVSSQNYFSVCEAYRLRPGEWSSEERDYWRGTLGGVIEGTAALPLFAASRDLGGKRSRVRHSFAEADIGEFEAAAARIGITLFEFIFSAYLVVLGRQTGMPGACAAFQSSGRRGREGAEGVIGEFSNALPVFTLVDPQQNFATFAGKVRGQVRAAIAHERFPYDQIIREAGFHPKFGMNWYPGVEKLVLDGQSYSAQHIVEWQSDFDLNLHCLFEGKTLHFDLSYPVGPLNSDRAEVVLRTLTALLREVSKGSSTPLGEVRLPGPDMPPAPLKAPVSTTLYERFSAIAERHARNVAIKSGDRKVTYRDLHRMVDEVADWASKAGVSTGTRVALCLDRGPELAAAILAADRLGAVFGIYDPAYPADRSDALNRTFRPRFIMTEGDPDSSEMILGKLRLDRLQTVAAPAALPRQTQYVLFTSGTTGKPKCVAADAQGLLSFLDWHVKTHGFGPACRFALLGGLGHDPFLRDLFTPLVSGGCVCVPPPDFRDNPRRLFDWFRREGITATHLTPQMGKLICLGRESGSLPDLEYLFWGGDKLPSQDVDAMRAIAPQASAVVFYGLTETPQAAAAYYITEPVTWLVAPIGRGVNGRRVTIKCGERDAAYGELGEIVIEASDLFLGYYDAESGMTDQAVGPIRSCHSGDTGFYLPSGDIAIVGRQDDQVKIRGYRIEPGELVAFLLQQPGIDEAAVLAEPSPTGENELLAYVTAEHGVKLLPADVLALCRRKLPQYMVPQAAFVLEAMPLTLNGKLDRTQLPCRTETSDDPQFLEPTTTNEVAIAEQVRLTLGRKKVSMASTVRDLGVDSLSYVTLMLGLEKVIGALPKNWDEIPLRDLARRQGKQSWLAAVESAILMRAASITAVVAGHFGLISFGGATSALYFIAGHSFGRFHVNSIMRDGNSFSVIKTAYQIAIPTIIVMVILQGYYSKITPLTWVFLGNFLGPNVAGGFSFWFIDIFIQMLLILAALFSFRSVRALAQQYPFATAFWFTVISFGVAWIVRAFWNTEPLFDRVPSSKIWLVGLGWCLSVSQTISQRILVFILAIFLLSTDWAFGREAQILTILSFIIVMMVDRVRMPRPMSNFVALVAGASLFIYLIHFQVRSIFHKFGMPTYLDFVAMVGAIIFGIVIHRLWEIMFRKSRIII